MTVVATKVLLPGAQEGSSRDQPQPPAAKEEKAELKKPRARQQAYGANKKFPYIDEEKH